jgi:hypothetical protein
MNNLLNYIDKQLGEKEMPVYTGIPTSSNNYLKLKP